MLAFGGSLGIVWMGVCVRMCVDEMMEFVTGAFPITGYCGDNWMR